MTWVVWDWFWVRAPGIVITAAWGIGNYSAWDRTGRGRWMGWFYVAMVVVMFVLFMVSPPPLVTDQQGSVRFSIEPGTTYLSADASTVKEQHYFPYGGSRVGGVAVTDRGYIGQTEDAATGLSYLNARYYDTRGVFISPDPIVGYAGPQTLNRFAYSVGNPRRDIEFGLACDGGLLCWYRSAER